MKYEWMISPGKRKAHLVQTDPDYMRVTRCGVDVRNTVPVTRPHRRCEVCEFAADPEPASPGATGGGLDPAMLPPFTEEECP